MAAAILPLLLVLAGFLWATAGYPVLGSWVIDGTAAGIGIRESATPVTDNLSAFVPHLFE